MTTSTSLRTHKKLFTACAALLGVLLSASLYMAWIAHSSHRFIPLPDNIIIDYTDTSLQVNTAHLSRMLLPDADSPKREYTVDELVQMTKSAKAPSTTTVTAVLFFGPHLAQQMKYLQKQSVPPQSIWIICATESDLTAVKQAHAITLQEISSLPSTAYVWLLDPGALPQTKHLQLLLATTQTKTFKHAIVGPGRTSDQCESATTRPVDTIFSSWLLQRDLIDADLVQSLQTNRKLLPTMLADIPRIGLPTFSKDNEENEYNVANNQIDMCSSNADHMNDIQDNVAFMISDRRHLKESWMRLVCAFVDRSQTAVHVIIPGAGTPGIGLEEVTKMFKKHHSKCFSSIHVYDLELPFDYSEQDYLPSPLAMELAIRTSRVLRTIQPQILIHQTEEKALVQILPMLRNEMHSKTTMIGLPPNSLKHVLWMKDIEFSSLQRWHDISIKLIVLISSSNSSLLQLLRSLQNAHYLGDKIDISMFLEHDADARAQELAERVTWRQGTKAIRHRIVPADRTRMMLESWYPSNNHEYGVILDDGLHLSPLFYIWAKYTILKYGQEANLYGVSLFSTRIIDTSLTPRYLDTPDDNAPYLMQSSSSFGAAVYFPEHWKELHDYTTARMVDMLSNGQQDIQVPATRSAHWTFSWRRYLDELVYLRGYVMLYPNFHDSASFATRRYWLDSKQEAKLTEIYKSPLLRESPILDQLPNHTLPEWKDLAVMDLWGETSTLAQLREQGLAFHNKVSACSPAPMADHDPSDLLCPFGFIVDKVDPKKKKKKKKKVVTVYMPQPTHLPVEDP